MGGLHISCGDFEGEDKSCSAIFGVITEIRKVCEQAQVLQALEAMQAKIEEDGYFEMTPKQAEILQPAITDYHSTLVQTFVGLEPHEAIDADEAAGIDPGAAKYGDGKGWQFYCTTDLVKALAKSMAEKEPVLIMYV